MAAPVIERLGRSARPPQILYTFFSPSAEGLAQKLPVDFAGILPFDTASAAGAMLDAVRPSAIVFSKLDVWPVLAETAAARGIPTALISATLAERSGRRSRVSRLLLSDAYASLGAIGAVDRTDAERLVEIGARADRITVTGDTRYDQVEARLKARSKDALVRRLASSRPTLVAGSTWPPDEAQLLVAFIEARLAVPDLRLVLAPHEPGTAARSVWEAAARERWSFAAIDSATPETDVIWVDRMGVLADLYSLATISYVGGGFHGKGLHSVVEPAAHGSPVLIGPRHGGSRDALMLIAAGGAFSVGDGPELGRRVVGLVSDPARRAIVSEKARGVFAAGLGAADRSTALVEKLLATPSSPSR
jgi:3-deoxy-D-manno-octulosonic-acid transferase